jgi:hypothetical protein
MTEDPDALGAGARNLLSAAGPLPPGAPVLICAEPAEAGYYDPGLAPALAAAIRAAGHPAEILDLAFDPEPRALPEGVAARMRAAAATIFLARIGDQLRFSAMPGGLRAVVSYALDREALAGPFGTVPHAAMLALKASLDRAVAAAGEIRVTCPAGTDVTGRAPRGGPPPPDVGLARFPMSVIRPIPAGAFSGQVALAGFLCGTGSMYYEPYAVVFDGPVTASFAEGRLRGFEGAARDVAAAEAQYDRVATRFGIDRDAVHSWHAGIHPGCGFAGPARADPVRWGGSAFGNPRILHFHTCGAYAPGEICWNVLDPTVTLDGARLWQAGRLRVEAVPEAAEVAARTPALARLLDDPVRAVGL